MQEIIQVLKNKWQMVVMVPLIVAMVAFIVSAFMVPKYLSEASIIVIQKHDTEKVDAFSAAKSAEYLSDILSKVVYTDTFFKDVMAAPFGIENDFSFNAEERKEQWNNTVNVKKINNTGIIQIDVYDESKIQAQKIAEAITWNLSNNGAKYHGGGESVEIKAIDGPNTFDNPAKPNIILNTVLGAIVGLVGVLGLAFYWEDFDLKLVKEKEDKEPDFTPVSESYSYLKR